MFVAMELTHLDRIVQLEKELFVTAWKKEDFIFELTSNPFANYYVLIKDEIIVGYIGYWIKDEYVEITTIGVDKSYQRQGLAYALLNFCFSDSAIKGGRIFTLEVRVSNYKAIALYEKAGFTKATIRKKYYKDTNEDAYLMMKEVK